MKKTDTTIDGLIFTISSDNDINFKVESCGDIIFHDMTIHDSPYNHEHKELIRFVKNHLKQLKIEASKDSLNFINSLGIDAGLRSYHFNIDNRLLFELKKRNLVISRFINNAISEKLERDS
jgi:hypothetical protein